MDRIAKKVAAQYLRIAKNTFVVEAWDLHNVPGLVIRATSQGVIIDATKAGKGQLFIAPGEAPEIV